MSCSGDKPRTSSATQDVVTDGWLNERWVVDLANWYAEHCPGVDPIDFESHLALMRSYTTITIDSPVDTVAGLSRARYNILRMLLFCIDAISLRRAVCRKFGSAKGNDSGTRVVAAPVHAIVRRHVVG